MRIQRESAKKLSIIVLCGLLLTGLVFYFGGLSPFTLVSFSKVTVEGVGWEDEATHRWMDDYWHIEATTDTALETKLIKWDETQLDDPNVDNTVVDGDEVKEIIPKANLEIKIFPEQPYYSVTLDWQTRLVYPKTWGTYKNIITDAYAKTAEWIPELKTSFWVLQDGWSYTLHTPYTAELWKNGALVDSVTDDSYGGKNQILLTDSSGGKNVEITNFGKGEYGYNPPVHGELIIFGNAVYEVGDAQEIIDAIEYDKTDLSYSNYWFGGGSVYTTGHDIFYPGGYQVWRYDDTQKTPAHLFLKWGDIWPSVVADDAFPGQRRADSNFDLIALPESADLRLNNPDTNPTGLSLINYLRNTFDFEPITFTNNIAIPWCTEMKIEDNQLKLMMPAGSAYSNIVVRIPTELADSIVFVEYYPTADISAFWTTGTTHENIGDKLKALVTVTNTAGFGGNLITKAYFTSQDPGVINPPQFGEYIAAGNAHLYEFTVINTGSDVDDPFTVKFEVWNEKPELLGTATLTGVFLKTQDVSTVVSVYTRNSETKEAINAILVTLNYEMESKTAYSVNGVAIFDLGDIETDVTIGGVDPQSHFKPAETGGHVQGGSNTFYLDMEPVISPDGDDGDLTGIIIAAAIITTVIVAVVIVVYRSRVKGRS